MNYKMPRQRKTDMRFDYTNRNDEIVYPIGYCKGFQPLDLHPTLSGHYQGAKRERLYEFSGKYHVSGHSTYDEACQCYKEFILDNHFKINEVGPGKNGTHTCDISGCGAWTTKMAEVANNYFFVCTGHANRETISKLLSVDSSIES